MKPTRNALSLIAALLALPIGAIAQDNAANLSAEVSNKSLKELRREAWSSEEDFYARYNELNDDPDFHVRCFYETPTGSRLKNHVCRAKFVTEAYSKNAGRKRFSANRTSRQDDNPEVAAKTTEFQEKLETFINTDADLQAAYLKYSNARAAFMHKLNNDS